ncbi:MAG: homoserine dehydrogenase [Actinomycetota bacterium]
MEERRSIGVAVLGCGIVGSGALRVLHANADQIAARVGIPVEVVGVGEPNLAKAEGVPVPVERFTADSHALVVRQDVDIVVEVIGGIEPARSLILEAMAAGKHVVTANKELLATRGPELFEAANRFGVDLYFEAAVGGGIPLIHPLRESLAGDRVTKVMGIVNGTTNYILTRMSESGCSFGEALAEAQSLGYAERDPSADIEGFDAAAKCAILATIAFDTSVVAGDVYREGITNITSQDISFAASLGYAVKLLAIAEEQDGEVAVRVHPAMIPKSHPLAGVRDAFNAVFVEGEAVGQLMFYGRGAGGSPTGAAIAGDIVDISRNLVAGGRGPGMPCVGSPKRVRPMDDTLAQYYILLDVADRPGVLATVAGVFGDNEVSIRSVWQEGTGEAAQLVLITHRARERDLQATLQGLERQPTVSRIASVMRVEGSEG